MAPSCALEVPDVLVGPGRQPAREARHLDLELRQRALAAEVVLERSPGEPTAPVDLDADVVAAIRHADRATGVVVLDRERHRVRDLARADHRANEIRLLGVHEISSSGSGTVRTHTPPASSF